MVSTAWQVKGSVRLIGCLYQFIALMFKELGILKKKLFESYYYIFKLQPMIIFNINSFPDNSLSFVNL